MQAIKTIKTTVNSSFLLDSILRAGHRILTSLHEEWCAAWFWCWGSSNSLLERFQEEDKWWWKVKQKESIASPEPHCASCCWLTKNLTRLEYETRKQTFDRLVDALEELSTSLQTSFFLSVIWEKLEFLKLIRHGLPIPCNLSWTIWHAWLFSFLVHNY